MSASESSIEPFDIADQLFGAITSGDVDAIRDLYSADAVVWHNYDGIEQTRDDNVRTLSWAIEHLGEMRYTDVRRTVTDNGFAQQHVLRAKNRDGIDVAIPACLFVAVENGKVTRIDEYIDSAHVRQLTAPSRSS